MYGGSENTGFMYLQGRIQLLSKVGVLIRHTIIRGVGGHAPGKINFW